MKQITIEYSLLDVVTTYRILHGLAFGRSLVELAKESNVSVNTVYLVNYFKLPKEREPL